MNDKTSAYHRIPAVEPKSAPPPPLRTRYEAISLSAGQVLLSVVAVASVMIVAGWMIDNPQLKRLWIAPNAIPASTALGLYLYGIAAFANTLTARTKWAQLPGRILAPPLLLAAIATLVETVMAADFSLAFPIGPQPENASGVTYPGPMAPNVSVSFLLLSLALLLPRLEVKGKPLAQVFSLIVVLTSISAIMGYALGVEFMCTIFGCIKVPLLSSLLFAAGAIGYVMTRPDVGFMRTFCSDELSGTIARRLAITSLAVPAGLWLRVAGVNAGLFDQNFGWFAFSALIIMFFWGSITIGAQGVAKVDEEKKEVEKRLHESSMALNEIYEAKLKVTKDRAVSLVGLVFAERYLVLEFLGKGGMSSVYKAQHVYMHKTVALKVLLPHLAEDQDSIRRFQREAKSASMLSHPNLLEVYDFGVESEGGSPYIVMQFLQGMGFDQFLSIKKRLSSEAFLTIFLQICNGLAHAHENGVVHRDIKPSNIMITQELPQIHAMVVDFGLAKTLDESAATKITATSEIIGSPLYMSPESFAKGELSAATDVYALGCVMYEALTGSPPVVANTISETVMKVMTEQPKPFAEDLQVPAELQQLIFSMLCKDPAERPTTPVVLQSLIALQAARTPSRT